MNTVRVIRRIRCGELEAVITATTRPSAPPIYSTTFGRITKVEDDRGAAGFVIGELLTVSKLARLAHTTLQAIAMLDDE